MTGHLTAAVRLPGVLLRHRFLLGQLAWRAFASRYAGAQLGWLWTPATTAVQFVLYVVVFSMIMDIKVESVGIDLAKRPTVGFGVFLMAGLVPFLALNDAVLRAARVFRSQVNLVQRVRLPLEVLVVGDLAGALLHHAVSAAIVIGVCAAMGLMSFSGLPALVGGAALLLLWILGLGLVAAVVGAAMADLSEALGLVMQVVFYGAPIVYPLALVPDGPLRRVVETNPLTPLVSIVRSGLIGTEAPGAPWMVASVIGAVVLVIVGAAALDRWRLTIPDML